MTKVLIAGRGTGGLATAPSLHAVGSDAEAFEQAPELHEVGVGINMLPHAVMQLAALGLLPALDRMGSAHVHADRRLVGFDERGSRAVARFERRHGGDRIEAAGDVPIAADGIHARPYGLLPRGRSAGLERYDAVARRDRMAGPSRRANDGDCRWQRGETRILSNPPLTREARRAADQLGHHGAHRRRVDAASAARRLESRRPTRRGRAPRPSITSAGRRRQPSWHPRLCSGSPPHWYSAASSSATRWSHEG